MLAEPARFGGFDPQWGCFSWIHLTFQMLVNISQALFRGCPSFEELLFSLFSSMWILGDLNFHFWFKYAEIGVGLLAGSILVSRSILLCIFSIK